MTTSADTGDDRLITAVIMAVAAYADKRPEELPTLNDTIDPDALETLFGPRPDGTARRAGKIVFPYAGHQVTVTANHEVKVRPLESDVDWSKYR